MQLTKERLERSATEKQFMNGKIAAIDVSRMAEFARVPYRRFLLVLSPLVKSFPETVEYFRPKLGIKGSLDT